MPLEGFEPTSPTFERAKTVRVLDGVAMRSAYRALHYNIHTYIWVTLSSFLFGAENIFIPHGTIYPCEDYDARYYEMKIG
jgi:hypothetical protein